MRSRSNEARGTLFMRRNFERVGVKNASSEKEKCSPMEDDDDDDNDASDRASFFSPMRGGRSVGRSVNISMLFIFHDP